MSQLHENAASCYISEDASMTKNFCIIHYETPCSYIYSLLLQPPFNVISEHLSPSHIYLLQAHNSILLCKCSFCTQNQCFYDSKTCSADMQKVENLLPADFHVKFSLYLET